MYYNFPTLAKTTVSVSVQLNRSVLQKQLLDLINKQNLINAVRVSCAASSQRKRSARTRIAHRMCPCDRNEPQNAIIATERAT